MEKAKLPLRKMKQTQDTFATSAGSYRENPLWIARIMGHRDPGMAIEVYSRYVENFMGEHDGANLDAVCVNRGSREG